jgi:hypothetical protein
VRAVDYARTVASMPLMWTALWLAVGQVAAAKAAERVAGAAS